MVCSSCGTENDLVRKFCKECGGPLAVTCAACGTLNAPDAKFCGECAARLHGRVDAGSGQASVPPPATAGTVAERRLVSVLFTDLVGFTALSEGLDPEETRDLLDRYFELARLVIGRYGGAVEKFIGDAVMAVWGAPTAHEDDAERAVRAGLELVDAVRSLGPGLQARAGILTGEAAVTLGALNQGMVAGDLVNTASRLQSAASPGTVLVGESTWRAASRAINFEPAGDHVLKGKAVPVAAWRALRVVAKVGGRGRSDGLEAPFVGRADELRLLKDLLHATVREGRTRLVSVFGPAGIGKSRLAWEFLKYADGLTEPVWWHDGRSPAYGDGISFWALGEMVRERCSLAETDDAATTRARVAETLAAHVPDAAERRWIEPALLALLGVETGVASDQLFAAWRTFFERLAASAPVVLVFEDLHSADAGLLDFIDHLLEWSRSSPIFVLTLGRPDLLERRADWGTAKRNFVSLFLEPLADTAIRELLAGLVPGLPDVAANAIVARADGIPLYAVETVRMLLADGRLVLDGDAYRPVGDLASLAVPDSLTALIGSRLDALPAAERALVSDAAVLGQSFTLAGLAAVAGVPEADLEPRMAALVRRELFRHEMDPRSPERGQYAFMQALIREVAYNTVARRDRKVRHLAAAGFFERLGSDELAGALAGHYLAAHANSSPGEEADAVAAQARVTLRAAAERAASLGSFAQAVTFLRQALDVTDDPATRAGLLEQAGSAAASGAQHETGRDLLTEAVAVHRELGDRVGACRATVELVRGLLTGPFRQDATRRVEAAADEFADLGETPTGIALRSQLARALFLDQRLRESITVADSVLELAEPLGLEDIVADLLVTKGSALAFGGRRREGVGVMETGARLAERLGLSFTVLRATLNGIAPIQEDDPAAGLATARRGLEVAGRLGLAGFTLPFLETGSLMALRVGEWDLAVRMLDEGLATVADPGRAHLLGQRAMFEVLRGESWDDLRPVIVAAIADDDPSTILHVRGFGGPTSLVSGDPGPVRETIAYIEEHYPDLMDPLYWSVLTRVSIWAGEPAAATRALEGYWTAKQRGRALDAVGAGLASGILALAGRTDEALTGYRASLRQLNDLGLSWEAALVGLDMATVLGPHDAEVSAAADEALATFGRLGARPFTDRLAGVLAQSGIGTSG